MRTRKKMIFSTRFWVLSVLLASVVLGPLSAHALTDSCAGGQNAGPSKGEATELQGQSRNVCVGNDANGGANEVWYKWTFDAPAQMEIVFANGGAASVLYAPGATTGTAPTGNTAGGPEWRMRAKPGTWYLQVKYPGSGIQNQIYNFSYLFQQQTDCVVPTSAGQDAGNTAATALEFAFSQPCNGQVWGIADPAVSNAPKLDTDDWFKMTGLVGGAQQSFVMTTTTDRGIGCVSATAGCASPTASGVKVTFTNSLGAPLAPTQNVPDQKPTQLSFTPATDGDYLIHLSSDGDYYYDLAKTPNVPTPTISPTIPTISPIPSVPQIPPSGLPTVVPTTVPGLSPDCQSGQDASNTSAGAKPLPTTPVNVRSTQAGDCIGRLGDGSDNEDWYTFTANVGQRIVLALTGDLNLDPDLYVVDPGGITRYSSTNGGAIPDTVNAVLTGTGTWRLRVVKKSSAGNYLLLMAITDEVAGVPSPLPTVPGVNPLNGDCNTGADAPNTNLNGRPPTISSNYACAGQIGIPASDTNDWYTFVGAKGQDVVSVLQGENTLDANLDLYSPAGVRVFPPTHFPSPEPEFFHYTLPSDGYWQLRISKVSGSGKYLLFLSVPQQASPGGVPNVIPSTVPAIPSTTPPTVPAVSSPDCGTGHDASGSLGSSDTPITPPTGCTGTLGAGDNDDFYMFNAVQGQRISINSASDTALNADIILYTPYEVDRGGFSGGPQTINIYAGDSGIYYLRVHRNSGSGTYGFGIYVGA